MRRWKDRSVKQKINLTILFVAFAPILLVLTQTLRAMERDGLVERTVHPVIPPKVEYRLTDLGHSLGEAFCGVWHWAGDNLDRVEAARKAFDDRG